MNPQVKEMWVKALRSGEYQQGRGELITMTDEHTKYCCLGVLCDLAMKEGIVNLQPATRYTQYEQRIRNFFGTEHEHNNGLAKFEILPPSVVHWAGLEDSNPAVYSVRPEFEDDAEEQEDKYLVQMAELNDEYGYPFEILAKLIEEQL